MLQFCFRYAVHNLVFIVNYHFFYQLRAEWLLVECLQDLLGGAPTFHMAAFSYISDITRPETRTKRMTLLAGVYPIGSNIGTALGGIVKNQGETFSQDATPATKTL